MIADDGLEFADSRQEGALELMRGPSGKWREDRMFQLGALDKLGLRPNDRFLEIGCGPLLAGAPLMRFLDPDHYTGVDVSHERLAAAKEVVAQFGLADRGPRLVRSDDFGLESLPAHSFDRIWSYQVVLHLTRPLVDRFMVAVAALLEPHGVAWFSAKVAGNEDAFDVGGPWLEFPVNAAGQGFFRSSAAEAGLSCMDLGTLGKWGLPSDRPGAKHSLFELKHSR